MKKYVTWRDDFFVPKVYEPGMKKYVTWRDDFFVPKVYNPGMNLCARVVGRQSVIIGDEVPPPPVPSSSPTSTGIEIKKSSGERGTAAPAGAAEVAAAATPMTKESSSSSPSSSASAVNITEGDIASHAVASSGSGGLTSDFSTRTMLVGRRIAKLSRQMTVSIKDSLNRTSTKIFTEVDDDAAAVFSRRMQCAFLLFLSWAYMVRTPYPTHQC